MCTGREQVSNPSLKNSLIQYKMSDTKMLKEIRSNCLISIHCLTHIEILVEIKRESFDPLSNAISANQGV